ncbi:hypothetical protein AAG906_008075 [Vitis piasezkii]
MISCRRNCKEIKGNPPWHEPEERSHHFRPTAKSRKRRCSRLHIRASATSSRPTSGRTRAVESSGEALSNQVRWPSPAKESQGSRFRANRLNGALSRALSEPSPCLRTSGGASAAH